MISAHIRTPSIYFVLKRVAQTDYILTAAGNCRISFVYVNNQSENPLQSIQSEEVLNVL